MFLLLFCFCVVQAKKYSFPSIFGGKMQMPQSKICKNISLESEATQLHNRTRI